LAVVSDRWIVGVIPGYVTGFVTAWRLGVPFGHLVLLTATVLVIALLHAWPKLQDATTRRYQATTERLVRLKNLEADDKRSWWRRKGG
jgi:hypothetical protein